MQDSTQSNLSSTPQSDPNSPASNIVAGNPLNPVPYHGHTGTDGSPQLDYILALINKPTIPVFPVTEPNISLSDVTTDNVTSTKHGFAPKSPADATKYLDGAATPTYKQVQDSDLLLSDITTNNATSAQHGFLPKLPNNTTQFLRADGTFVAPTPGVTLVQSGSNIVVSNTNSLTDIFSYSIAANTLGTSKGFRVTLWVNPLKNATNSVDLFFRYGSTFNDINFGSQNINRPGKWECSIIADGATNKQRAASSFIGSATGITQGTSWNFGFDSNQFSEDSTTTLNLKCQIQFSSASVNDTITIAHYTLEFLT